MTVTRRALLAAMGSVLATSALAQGGMQGPPALFVRPVPRPVPDAADLVRGAGLRGQVAYAVTDAATGALAEDGRPDQPMPPASTMKIITALYALDRLGPQHRFRTRVMRAGDMIILAGGGDPVLSTDDLAVLAEQLAMQVAASGGSAPTRFGVWGGALPQMAHIVPDQAPHLAYNPALSGMILNFNRVWLGWRRDGADDGITIQARAARHSPRAYSITALAQVQTPLFTYRQDGDHEIWTMSRAAMGRAGSRWLPVRSPELYAGDVFQTLCRAQGLILPQPEVIADLPDAMTEMGALDSPPLTTLLRDMLHYSTNLTAEVLGLHASGAPDLAASARAMQDWLTARGQGAGFVLADHSGLSDDTRVTARGMALLLSGAVAGGDLPSLMKTDPLMRGQAGVAQVRAKTGTLNFVSNLAGYATAPDGRMLAFAILCADAPQLAATRGRELPAGLRTWIGRAKGLQGAMIDGWARAYSMR